MLSYSNQAAESTFGYQGAATTNYGTNAQLSLGQSAVGQARRSFVRFPSLPSAVAVVSNPVLSLYSAVEGLGGNRDASIYRSLRNWVQSQLTWNIYSTGNNWNTAGSAGIGTDFDNNILSTVTISSTIAANTKVDFALDAALFLEYLNNQATYPGGFFVYMAESSTSYWNPHSNDAATAGYRPLLVFDYSLIKSVSGVTNANIKSVAGVAIASIKSVSGLN